MPGPVLASVSPASPRPGALPCTQLPGLQPRAKHPSFAQCPLHGNLVGSLMSASPL